MCVYESNVPWLSQGKLGTSSDGISMNCLGLFVKHTVDYWLRRSSALLSILLLKPMKTLLITHFRCLQTSSLVPFLRHKPTN